MAGGLLLFSLGFVCSKLLAVAMLASASAVALAVWLMGECALFLLVRMSVRNWRFHLAIGDSTSFSVLAHVGTYLIMLAAPIPLARIPFILSPSVCLSLIHISEPTRPY